MEKQILTLLGIVIAQISFIYVFLRNFKKDNLALHKTTNKKLDSMNMDISSIKERLVSLEALEKIASEERIAKKVINIMHEETERKKKKAKGE